MARIKAFSARFGLMSFLFAFGIAECSAQVGAEQTSEKFLTHFLDRSPDATELRHMPTDARDSVVAKVKLVEPLRYFSNRDQSGLPPPPPPPPSSEVFFARIEIIEAVQGAAPAYDVHFGARHLSEWGTV